MKNLIIIALMLSSVISDAQKILKVGVAGLSHDHVNPILEKQKAGQIEIIGIAEPDLQLCKKKKKDYQLPDSIFFKDLKSALQNKHPDLVMVYEAPAEHLSVVEICMPLHIPVLIEKPLAFSNEDAARIKTLSEKFNTKVYTNFPSIAYSSFNELLKDQVKQVR